MKTVLRVDERSVPLNDFVSAFLANLLVCLVNNYDGPHQDEEIDCLQAALSPAGVEVVVDGAMLEFRKPFTVALFRKTLLGALSALDGAEGVHAVLEVSDVRGE